MSLNLRLGLGLSRRGATAAFTPLSLFGAAEAGAWYDPSDLSTMFQNSNGTGAVTADGDPVGYIADKSGNGNHAIQATGASRPLYKTSGGLRWLEFDGVDDHLQRTLGVAINQPNEVVAGLQVIVIPGGNQRIIGGLALGVGPSGLWMYSGGSVVATAISGATNYVTNARFNGASSRINTNRAAYVTGDPASAGTSIFTLGAENGGSFPTNVRIYGAIILNRVMTAGEIASSEAHMAAKSGVTL